MSEGNAVGNTSQGLSSDGKVNNLSAERQAVGDFRSDYTKNKEAIAKKNDNSLPALETSPATVDGKVQDTVGSGNLLSGDSSLSESSECKVNTLSANKQAVGNESSYRSGCVYKRPLR